MKLVGIQKNRCIDRVRVARGIGRKKEKRPPSVSVKGISYTASSVAGEKKSEKKVSKNRGGGKSTILQELREDGD